MIAPETRTLGILAKWYAEPLNHEEATSLLELAAQHEQQLLKRSGRPLLSSLLKLIALHWLGEPTEEHYHYLTSQHTDSVHLQILRPLVYGQLLMSSRLEGATDHLNTAFHQARLLLRPEDYFTLMRRHHSLQNIPLSAQATGPETLQQLLTTASVIARIQQSQEKRKTFWHDPNDTYG